MKKSAVLPDFQVQEATATDESTSNFTKKPSTEVL